VNRYPGGERGDGAEPMGMKSDLVDVAVLRIAETEKAILVSDDGEREGAVWLPKSQVEIENGGLANHVTVTLPEWLARDKGLI